jgi:viroplasmin and RNaseH domain-containing protein
MLTLLLITILIAQNYAIELNYINVINYSNGSESWTHRKMSTNIPIYTFNITDDNENNSYYREDKYDWIIYTM